MLVTHGFLRVDGHTDVRFLLDLTRADASHYPANLQKTHFLNFRHDRCQPALNIDQLSALKIDQG
jgi:hypothetical protein